jgi:hypothetical protein
MELDITAFFQNADPSDYSASVAELGRDAARITWRLAMDSATDHAAWLNTDEARDEFRAYVKGFGAWDAEEIAAWSNDELTALLIQMIAGDIREAGLDTNEPDWDAYEKGAEAGRFSGRLYPGANGRIYYTIGD